MSLNDSSPVCAVVEAYRREGDALVRFATVLVGSSDAEDVVSDALVRVLDLAEDRRLDNPVAYLFRSVSNTAKNHHRSRWRRRLRDRKAAELDRRPDSGGSFSPEVLAAMGQLSQQQRAVIFLTYWADLTPASIADRLGVSEGSVRKQLARGRSKLKKVLDDRP